jgi:MFS family permease
VVTWVPLALVGFGLVGAGFSIIFPLALSAAGRTTPQVSGTAIATVAMCGYVGFLVGPAVIGFGAGALNLRVAPGLVVLLSQCVAGFARVVGDVKPDEGGQAKADGNHAEPVISLRNNTSPLRDQAEGMQITLREMTPGSSGAQ